MSDFMKRIGDVAKKAKDTLEDSGVIDDIKGIVSDAVGSVASGTSASDSSAGARSGADAVVPAGAVDPVSLVTPQDVSEVTGRTFDEQYPFPDEE